MNKMLKFVKRPRIIILAIIIVIVGIFVYFNFFRNKNVIPQFVLAQRGTIIQEVSVTGNTKPIESVNLSFEKGGRIRRTNVNVGDKVDAGQILVELDSSELLAQLRENEAGVQAQKAKLDELKRGTRPEEIQVKQAELNKAQQDLTNEYIGVPDVLNDAYVKADDAVRVKTDTLFTNENTTNPLLTFIVSDSQLETDVKYLRFLSEDRLNKWKEELRNISANSSTDKLEQSIKNAREYLLVIRDFLQHVLEAVDKNAGLTASTADTYKTNVNSGRTNVNTAFTNVSDKEQAILAEKLVVNKIKDELNLKLAGSTQEAIAAQEAQLRQAEASVQLVQAQIGKTILHSPIKGTITKQDAKIGQIAQANVVLVSIISQDRLEIEANIPEADIAKVKIGNSAKITLDAYGNDVVFETKVVSIDPGETIIEGVATYKTKLHFLKEDERIKPGMTTNIDILTDKRENAISIPQRAVIGKNGDKMVKILVGDTVSEIKVKTGLRGSDGNIEIIEGINEGDKVVMTYQ